MTSVSLKAVPREDAGDFWDRSIQTMPRPELEGQQLRLLRQHLDFASHNSPWYGRTFRDAGVSAADLRSLDDLRQFPFVDKQAIRESQQAAPLLGQLLAVPEREVVYVSASSGSTGVPTLSPFTAADFDAWQDLQARLFYQAGIRDRDRYLHALNFSLFVGGPDVIGAQRLGALCIWAGTVPADRLLFLAKEFQPTVTWTTPSYAWYLGETALAQGLDPARDLAIRKIIVAGEPGGSSAAVRANIERCWAGATVFDHHGMTEVGPVSYQCPEQPGTLMVISDHLNLTGRNPLVGHQRSGEERFPDMTEAYSKRLRGLADAVIAFEPVPREDVIHYGIAAPRGKAEGVFVLDDLIEKPEVDEAPSALAVAARYVFSPAVFECLDETQPGKNGEIQLTDAVRLLIRRGGKALGVCLSPGEQRFDIGNFESYFLAFTQFALSDAVFGQGLREQLTKMLDGPAK